MKYEFTLFFESSLDESNEELVLSRLAEVGCTDAHVALAFNGRIELDFVREAASGVEAFLGALLHVENALPGSKPIGVRLPRS